MLRILVATSVIALFGCASEDMGRERASAASADRDCFNTRSISGFSGVDDNTVQIRTGGDDYYEIDVFGTCNQLDWANRLTVVSDQGGFICAGDPSPGRVVSEEESCRITNVTRVYPEDVGTTKTLEDEADS